eukprot:TRINITY_DN8877_c0_g1_i10.p1 TRINITY_DN8877_c0_g1~~TRINITY_DN8877_c0_g1_i10.p1  ORF type:complete len:216 (-),score=-23.17 TRINITY_DN8877_c0_g1_i10:35-682(-)
MRQKDLTLQGSREMPRIASIYIHSTVSRDQKRNLANQIDSFRSTSNQMICETQSPKIITRNKLLFTTLQRMMSHHYWYRIIALPPYCYYFVLCFYFNFKLKLQKQIGIVFNVPQLLTSTWREVSSVVGGSLFAIRQEQEHLLQKSSTFRSSCSITFKKLVSNRLDSRSSMVCFLLNLRFPKASGSSVKAISFKSCLLYTSPSPRDGLLSRMPSSA